MALLCLFFGCMVDWRESATCRALSPVREGLMGVTTHVNGDRFAGATLEDCIKLFSTIRDELMSDAKIEIMLPTFVEPKHRPVLIVHTQGFSETDGQPIQRVWATRVLGNESVGFTYNALYECLIVSYRGMEGFLLGQGELPLSEG